MICISRQDYGRWSYNFGQQKNDILEKIVFFLSTVLLKELNNKDRLCRTRASILFIVVVKHFRTNLCNSKR